MAKGKTAKRTRRKATAPIKFTTRHNLFCIEYIKDFNATQASIRAGYSPNGADVTGVRLLGNARVTARISELTKKLTDKLEITAERVLTEIARLAFFDIRKLYHADGRIKEPFELDEDTARAIAGIDVNVLKANGVAVSSINKFKSTDKKGALEMLAKHLGLIKDRFSFEGENPLERITLTVYDNGRDPPPAKT